MMEDKISDLTQKKIEDNKCENDTAWVFQFLFPLFTLGSVWAFKTMDERGSNDFKFEEFFSILSILSYIIYMVMALKDSTFHYLNNLQKNESIHDFMEKYFYSKPQIKMTCTCYHYSYRGRNNTKHKEITHVDVQYFQFSSFTDNSGLFLVNNGNINKRNYLKLRIDIDVEFADEITKYDFKSFKENMIEVNKKRDSLMDYEEEITLSEGFDKYNLIRFGGNECLISVCAFIIFCIIPLIQFYKCYFSSRCQDQVFTIKKRISTRYNLNDQEYANNNYQSTPRIKIEDNEIFYNNAPKDFNQCYDLPSEDEIMRAKTFSEENNNIESSYICRLSSNSHVRTYEREDKNNENYQVGNPNMQEKFI